MRISAIAALARRRLIGRAGAMPWHLPADLARFKALTMGKPMIMGRRTFESIGRPLPGRRSIVVSRTPGYAAPGCAVVASVDAALAAAAPCDEAMVIGGATIFAQLLDRTERLYLTLIEADLAGDAYFPPYEHLGWREVERAAHAPDARNPYPYLFLTLDRIS